MSQCDLTWICLAASTGTCVCDHLHTDTEVAALLRSVQKVAERA